MKTNEGEGMSEEHMVTAAVYALLWEQVKAENETLRDRLRDLLDLIGDDGSMEPDHLRRVQLARAVLE